MSLSDLYLIDGSSLIYKAFYAIRNLNRSNGDPVNALYGLSRMTLKLIKDRIKPNDKAVFVMDKSRKTFRTQMYAEYKANRPEMPEDLRFQMKYVESFINSFGIKCSSMPDYEADDIIATYALGCKSYFDSVFIVSGDKDLLQLIKENIFVLRTDKGVTDIVKYDANSVLGKYELRPDQIIDYLSIVGDKSDNVPGIKGIGEKGAVALLREFDTLDNIYENIESISGKNRDKLSNSREIAFLSKKLITLCHDVPDLPDIEYFDYSGINYTELKKLFEEFEFKKLVGEIEGYSGTEKKQLSFGFAESALIEENSGAGYDYVLISDDDMFSNMLSLLKDAGNVCIDLETDSLNALEANIIGISVCFTDGTSYYMPFGHLYGTNLDKKNIGIFLSSLKDKTVIGHNLKYDLNVLISNGYECDFKIFDTMVAVYLTDPDKQRYKLDILAKEFFDYDMLSYGDLLKEFPFAHNFSHIPVERACFYSCEDSDFTFRLFKYSSDILSKLNLEKVFYDIEMPFLKVIMEMERNGVYFDISELNKFSRDLQLRLSEIEKEIFLIAGEEFNINSPVQVGRIFFEKLGMPPIKKTSKNKNYSTNQSVLEELASDYPVARKLLEYRKLNKLKTSYVDSIPRLVYNKTGRVHSNFKQTGTATGRISSTEPNMQNLPIKSEEGREIRNSIKPQKEGWKLLSADYSQIELRLMAHLSDDENLIDAFIRNQDIHAFTASKIFDVPFEDVTQEMRRIGKTINFSIIYGISAFGLSSRLSISRKEAAEFIKNYFRAYGKIEDYIENMIQQAENTGMVRTLFGRLRAVKYINSRNRNLKEEAGRIAVNSPVQGTAADIVKIAMVNIYKKIKELELKSLITIQIHDEIVIESPENEVEKVSEILKEEMENAVVLKVPLSVDIEIGNHF